MERLVRLTDAQWGRIEPLLPRATKTGGRNAKPHRPVHVAVAVHVNVNDHGCPRPRSVVIVDVIVVVDVNANVVGDGFEDTP